MSDSINLDLLDKALRELKPEAAKEIEKLMDMFEEFQTEVTKLQDVVEGYEHVSNKLKDDNAKMFDLLFFSFMEIKKLSADELEKTPRFLDSIESLIFPMDEDKLEELSQKWRGEK